MTMIEHHLLWIMGEAAVRKSAALRSNQRAALRILHSHARLILDGRSPRLHSMSCEVQ